MLLNAIGDYRFSSSQAVFLASWERVERLVKLVSSLFFSLMASFNQGLRFVAFNLWSYIVLRGKVKPAEPVPKKTFQISPLSFPAEVVFEVKLFEMFLTGLPFKKSIFEKLALQQGEMGKNLSNSGKVVELGGCSMDKTFSRLFLDRFSDLESILKLERKYSQGVLIFRGKGSHMILRLIKRQNQSCDAEFLVFKNNSCLSCRSSVKKPTEYALEELKKWEVELKEGTMNVYLIKK